MAQANTYSIMLTNNKHGKRELETYIKSFNNRKMIMSTHNHCYKGHKNRILNKVEHPNVPTRSVTKLS